MKVYFHGECVIRECKQIPKGAKKVKPISGRYIVADSETTGNHHCIEAAHDAEMFKEHGVFYLRNESPVKMFCVDKSRHDNDVLPAGIWEIDRANEFDYLSEMKRKVAD